VDVVETDDINEEDMALISAGKKMLFQVGDVSH